MNTSVSLYLDQRRALSNGEYPLKVRVYDPRTRKTKYYLLNRSLTQKEFAEINSAKPKKPFRNLKIEINSLLARYFEITKGITPFSFQKLEQELNLSKLDKNDVASFLEYMAKEDEHKGKLKNAKLYISAKNSFLKYQRTLASSKSSTLSFLLIDREWLEGYEGFMVNVLGLSRSTVGVYLRQLRTAWNKLSQNSPELKELYPFRKELFTIPATKKVKRGLTKEDLQKLKRYKPVSEGESFAKDLWLVSFYLSGINVSDLLKLKVKDYNQGMISFIRTKTQGSRRSDLSPIILPVNEIILKFFNRYGNPEGAPNDFILSFLCPEMNGKQIHDKVHSVNKRARKHLNRIALKLDLPENLSMQWARHTYAKQAINLGQTMEFVGNSLGHSDIKTTQAYFSGFESKQRIKLQESLVKI